MWASRSNDVITWPGPFGPITASYARHVNGTAGRASAPIPDDEVSRLAALDEMRVLDTAAESAFDEIVRLAAIVCHSPVALISFIDRDRQWFKAAHGWQAASTGRDVALCAYTILVDDHFIVEDTRADSRIAGHPVLELYPDVRFYAGVPLRVGTSTRPDASRASAIGTLCVLDTQPRQLSDDELTALHILAGQAERLLTERLRRRDHAELLAHKAALRHRYNVVAESMLCGVVVHGPDGSIESANPAAEAILGLTVDQMQGRTPMHANWRCVHPDGSPFPGDEHPASVTLRDGVPVRDVMMGVTRADGARRWILINSSPLEGPIGELDGAVATFVDVTSEIDLRDQLQQSLGFLERSTHEHAALTAALSHDLAAPAAAVRILADVLRDMPDGIERVRAVDALITNAHRVEERIADLAAMATRVPRAVEPKRTSNDVRALVIRGCAHASRPVDVVLPPHPVLADVDTLQIERIVDNLVSNACKHTPRDRNVSVTLSDASVVTITVDDDGPEIPPSSRDAIFEPFRRLSSDADGDGVGLYLVRQFARFHGGSAVCESRPGGGNRFIVTIAGPAAAPTPTE
jgi:PAS domain S-box-containing protein